MRLVALGDSDFAANEFLEGNVANAVLLSNAFKWLVEREALLGIPPKKTEQVKLTLTSGEKIYFACDTGLFGDMALIGAGGLDLAVLPIGDLFTMGPDDALEAVKLLKPRKVVPSHYNTWPPIAQDPNKWAERVRAGTKSEAVVVEPGGSVRF